MRILKYFFKTEWIFRERRDKWNQLNINKKSMKVNKELVWKLWRLNGGNVQKVILAYEKSKQENDDPLGNNQLTVERVQNYSIMLY